MGRSKVILHSSMRSCPDLPACSSVCSSYEGPLTGFTILPLLTRGRRMFSFPFFWNKLLTVIQKGQLS